MRVFVTGATGFIGGYLVDELLREHDVTCLCRRDSSLLTGMGCDVVVGDLTDASIGDAEAVFHLAGVIDERKDMFDVNVKGTRKIAEECQRKNARLVHMSSVAVVGEPKYLPVDEKHPLNPKTAYEKSKCEAEKIALSMGNAVALRPPVVYGPNRLWAKTLKMAQKGFPIIGNGRNRFHIAYVKNVVEACSLALVNGDGAYFIADPVAKTYEQVYEIMVSAIGGKKRPGKIPKTVVMPFVLAMEALGKVTGKGGILTKANVDRITRDRSYSIAKARRELGYVGKYGIEEGFKETVNALREQGFLQESI